MASIPSNDNTPANRLEAWNGLKAIARVWAFARRESGHLASSSLVNVKKEELVVQDIAVAENWKAEQSSWFHYKNNIAIG